MQVGLLIDSLEYITTNCYQHQLFKTFYKTHVIQPITLEQIRRGDIHQFDKLDSIVSVLKLRTLFNNRNVISKFLKGASISVYDQDPWESLRDDAPYSGAYSLISNEINVRHFGLTTERWTEIAVDHGYNAKFVRMWMLPEYCAAGTRKPLNQRPHDFGFIGTIHPYRKTLFDRLAQDGVNVVTLPNKFSYPDYLKALQDIKIFIHHEDLEVTVKGKNHNINTGLWIKDVEAASQGCLTLRNTPKEDMFADESYLDNLSSCLTYSSIDHVAEVANFLLRSGTQHSVDQTIAKIKSMNCWIETVNTLVE